MPSITARLRAETRSLHVQVERSPLMSALLKGAIDPPAYAALLANLRVLYTALEAALSRHAAHPALLGIHWPSYERATALREDLASLGDSVIGQPPLPATRLYADRLAKLSDRRPELLLAHAYVRYLGDLSGGQILSRIVAASPRLGPAVGTAFYDFGDASVVAALAGDFRDGLDRAEVADADALVAEAQDAFVRHRDIFDQLARAHGIVAASSSTDP